MRVPSAWTICRGFGNDVEVGLIREFPAAPENAARHIGPRVLAVVMADDFETEDAGERRQVDLDLVLVAGKDIDRVAGTDVLAGARGGLAGRTGSEAAGRSGAVGRAGDRTDGAHGQTGETRETGAGEGTLPPAALAENRIQPAGKARRGRQDQHGGEQARGDERAETGGGRSGHRGRPGRKKGQGHSGVKVRAAGG